MDDDTLHYLLDSIHTWIWSGFYTQDEVRELLAERSEDEGAAADDARLRQAVAEEWAAWQQAQATWPPTTDCDRLDAAFRQLSQQGLVALQNAGYTTSEGHEDTTEALDSLPDPSAAHGYCFYHGQDLEGAVAGYGLLLAFGALTSDAEADTLAVGQQVRAVLEGQGLAVAWDGTVKQRLRLPALVWQRRPGTRPGLDGWYDLWHKP